MSDQPTLNQPPKPSLSVVIPFYNEEANLHTVLTELRGVLDAIGQPYEVLAVNDGSRDATAERLDDLAGAWPELRPTHQSPNQGQAAALWAGFQQARGKNLVVMDGDGQNDPAALPAMLLRLTESDADLVAGVRAQAAGLSVAQAHVPSRK